MMETRNRFGVRNTLGAVFVLTGLLAGARPMVAWESAGENPLAPPPSALLAWAAAPQSEGEEAGHPPESLAEGAEHAADAHGEAEAEHHSVWEEIFHWFNLVVLLAGLGYLVKKALIPFLNERSSKIREDMDRSAKALADAEQRLAVVEEKMKSMNEEMASLRQAALHETAAERERIEQAATADAGKVMAAAEQEIDAAVKAARQDLKVYASELALRLAEKNLRAGLTPAADQRILQNFVKDLTSGDAKGNGQKSAAPSGRKQE
jgi:F0F1-type ATP synthase membrane subunit b/b'